MEEEIAKLSNPGLASIDAQSFDYRSEDHDNETLKVIVPEPTLDQIQYYEFGEDIDENDPEAVEDEIQAFKDSDAYYEWSEQYSQQMTSVWPVRVFNKSLEDIANVMDQLSIAAAIAEVPDHLEDTVSDYNALIVMTGGGLDLSNDIAQAYLVCGQVPPTVLMEGMGTAVMDRFFNDDMKALMGQAMRKAADHHKYRAERLEEIADRHFPEESAAPKM